MKVVKFIGKVMETGRLATREFETQDTECEIEREFLAFVERSGVDIAESTWCVKEER